MINIFSSWWWLFKWHHSIIDTNDDDVLTEESEVLFGSIIDENTKREIAWSFSPSIVGESTTKKRGADWADDDAAYITTGSLE